MQSSSANSRLLLLCLEILVYTPTQLHPIIRLAHASFVWVASGSVDTIDVFHSERGNVSVYTWIVQCIVQYNVVVARGHRQYTFSLHQLLFEQTVACKVASTLRAHPLRVSGRAAPLLNANNFSVKPVHNGDRERETQGGGRARRGWGRLWVVGHYTNATTNVLVTHVHCKLFAKKWAAGASICWRSVQDAKTHAQQVNQLGLALLIADGDDVKDDVGSEVEWQIAVLTSLAGSCLTAPSLFATGTHTHTRNGVQFLRTQLCSKSAITND